jgi:hypothetical protein
MMTGGGPPPMQGVAISKPENSKQIAVFASRQVKIRLLRLNTEILSTFCATV